MKMDEQVVKEKNKNVALELMKATKNKIEEILSYSKNNERKLITLHNENMQMLNMMQAFLNSGLKCQIPGLTAKQLFYMYNRGYTVDELSGISGYTTDEVLSKLKTYL